jgi:hypothetical protein
VNAWWDRLSLWQWAAWNASSIFLVEAIVWSWEQSTHFDPWHWGRFGWWTHYGIIYLIGYTGCSTLACYLKTRRRRKRASKAED